MKLFSECYQPLVSLPLVSQRQLETEGLGFHIEKHLSSNIRSQPKVKLKNKEKLVAIIIEPQFNIAIIVEPQFNKHRYIMKYQI